MRASSFRFALLAALLAAVLLALLAPAVALAFDEPQLVPLLLMIASGFLLQPYLVVAIPTLQADLRFREISLSALTGVVVQAIASLSLARLGWGASALVLGVLAGQATNVVVLAVSTQIRPWRGHRTMTMAEVGRLAGWPMSGQLMTHAQGRVDYFILGLFAPTAIIGTYYFAFQLVAKGAEVLLSGSRNVLVPAFSRFSSTRDQERGMYRAGTALALVGGTGSALVIGAFRPVNTLVWEGQWDLALPAVLALAAVLPAQVAASAPEQLLKARGGFRLWTGVIAAKVGGVALVTFALGIAAKEDLTAAVIGAAMALLVLINAGFEVLFLARRLRFSFVDFWSHAAAVWLPQTTVGLVVAVILASSSVGAATALIVSTFSAAATGGTTAFMAARFGWLKIPRRAER